MNSPLLQQAVERIRHTLMTGLAHNDAIAALNELSAIQQQPEAVASGAPPSQAPTELKPRELVGYGDCRCVLTQYCDGTCNAIYADAVVVERAKTLYADSPQAYRGTRPLPWPRAPLPTRLEFIEKAKAIAAPAALQQQEVPSEPVARYEAVGTFMEDGGRWLKMDTIYENDADAVTLYRAPSPSTAVQQEAGSDTDRLDWLMRNISGADSRRLGIMTSAGVNRENLDAAIAAAPTQQPPSDQQQQDK